LKRRLGLHFWEYLVLQESLLAAGRSVAVDVQEVAPLVVRQARMSRAIRADSRCIPGCGGPWLQVGRGWRGLTGRPRRRWRDYLCVLAAAWLGQRLRSPRAIHRPTAPGWRRFSSFASLPRTVCHCRCETDPALTVEDSPLGELMGGSWLSRRVMNVPLTSTEEWAGVIALRRQGLSRSVPLRRDEAQTTGALLRSPRARSGVWSVSPRVSCPGDSWRRDTTDNAPDGIGIARMRGSTMGAASGCRGRLESLRP